MIWTRNDEGGGSRAQGCLKLLTQLDHLFSNLAQIIAGTGKRRQTRCNNSVRDSVCNDTDMQQDRTDDSVWEIESHEGWTFAFEGGAHILFRYTARSRDHRFEGKLLRLAKRNQHTLPILKKHQAVQDTFLPLLTPPNGEVLVVHTELVRISQNVLERLQTEQVEGSTKRGSVLDLEETHGTLLEDLSADPTILLLDFKPKWLSQSPTAPEGANTCRTCALRRLRNKHPKAKPRFCPLDLSSGKRERVHKAIIALLAEKGIQNNELSLQITEHVLTSSLVPTLLKAQTSPKSSLATKMTLRDCTLFVQVPRELFCDDSFPITRVNGDGNDHGQTRSIRIVIADLDEKSEENRGEYWQCLEDDLISGGYYHGNGKLDDSAEDCDLTGSIWGS